MKRERKTFETNKDITSSLTDSFFSLVINGILMAQRTAAFDVAFKEPRRHLIEEVVEKVKSRRSKR